MTFSNAIYWGKLIESTQVLISNNKYKLLLSQIFFKIYLVILLTDRLSSLKIVFCMQ